MDSDDIVEISNKNVNITNSTVKTNTLWLSKQPVQPFDF